MSASVTVTPTSGPQTSTDVCPCCHGCCGPCTLFDGLNNPVISCCFSNKSKVTVTFGTLTSDGASIVAPALSGQTIELAMGTPNCATAGGPPVWFWTSPPFTSGTDTYIVGVSLSYPCGFQSGPVLLASASVFNEDSDTYDQVEGDYQADLDSGWDCCQATGVFDNYIHGTVTYTITNNNCCVDPDSGHTPPNPFCRKLSQNCDGTCEEGI